jgi:hypothetical protein
LPLNSSVLTAYEPLSLATPPLPRLVPDGIFDAFGWCASDRLTFRRGAAFDATTPTTSQNPAGMAFVMLTECSFLPRELARMHVGDLASADEWALAPYGIDDATDELFKERARPRDCLCLAAHNLDGLVWGLHDWCHFHNHGPFDSPAWTEVQCDASALVWLWLNRDVLGLSADEWERRRAQLLGVSRERFVGEGLVLDESFYDGARLRGLL